MKVQLNIDSEQKCLQSRLETVRRRRVANGARQPVPFHAAGPATTKLPNFVAVCTRWRTRREQTTEFDLQHRNYHALE